MKLLAVIFSFALVQTCFAQTIELDQNQSTFKVEQRKTYLEVGIIPTYFVNKLQIGFATVGKRHNEFTFSLLGRYIGDNDFEELHRSFGMHISWNKSIKRYSKGILYLPIWTRSTLNRSVRIEEGGYRILGLHSVGSGLGYKRVFKNEHQFRMEGNLGLYFGFGVRDIRSPNEFQLIPIPLPRLSFRYMIPISK